MKGTSEFVEYAIEASSNIDNSWGASFLNIRDSSSRAMRSENTNQSTVTFSGIPAGATVVLYNANFTTYEIDGNNTQSWGSPAYNPSTFSLVQDKELLIYKHRHEHASFNHTYMRLVIPSQSTTDGESFFKLGIFAVPKNIQDFSGYASGLGTSQDSEGMIAEHVSEGETGRMKNLSLSDIPTITFGLSGNQQETPENRERMSKVFLNPNRPIVYVDMEDGDDYYFVHRGGSMGRQRPGITHRNYSISLRTIK